VLVGAVITLNVALGGMKGITLVQAFQYWAKMFAISVPIFVLMAVYGHYGKQLRENVLNDDVLSIKQEYLNVTNRIQGAGGFVEGYPKRFVKEYEELVEKNPGMLAERAFLAKLTMDFAELSANDVTCGASKALLLLTKHDSRQLWIYQTATSRFPPVLEFTAEGRKPTIPVDWFRRGFQRAGFSFIEATNDLIVAPINEMPVLRGLYERFGIAALRSLQIVQTQDELLGMIEFDTRREVMENYALLERLDRSWQKLKFGIRGENTSERAASWAVMAEDILSRISDSSGDRLLVAYELLEPQNPDRNYGIWVRFSGQISNQEWRKIAEAALVTDGIVAADGETPVQTNRCVILAGPNRTRFVLPAERVEVYARSGLLKQSDRQPLPNKAPADSTWLSPFGPLTTKAAKAAAAALTNRIAAPSIPLRADLLPTDHMTVTLNGLTLTQALVIYADITGRQLFPRTNGIAERLDDALNGRLSQLNLVKRAPEPDSGVRVHRDGYFTPAEVKETVETFFKTNGLALAPEGERYFRVVNRSESPAAKISPQAWLAEHERPLALLYTYSLIIALVCGTAGLPHILVRFYTNPDGVAAKRTTMWVMILIGVFYLFPPIFGVIGRNLLPGLYAGVGAKGTDKIVLELPRILNERYGALGSILSGITCAGAFAAFMSTFSGLLVSMTGALAHDVYGRMLKPKSTSVQRLRAFRIAAVVIGVVAILIGTQVEPLQINFMVGQAFAIAAASYFPLLFMAVWWRKLTMKGAASGMLTGGLLALIGITLTSFSDLGWLRLAGFWAAHPLLRILCEQPAIWTVPLAIGLMIVVSNLTQGAVPADIRMKMLVLHAPEKIGLKQEYIQEHQTR
jgi:Na+(H+)/acetate symporter ActP